MTNHNFPTRTKRVRVAVPMYVTIEYYENWTETKEINQDLIKSQLELPDDVILGTPVLSDHQIQCDDCSEWKPASEFPSEIAWAPKGSDFCTECRDAQEADEAREERFHARPR